VTKQMTQVWRHCIGRRRQRPAWHRPGEHPALHGLGTLLVNQCLRCDSEVGNITNVQRGRETLSKINSQTDP